MRNRLAPLLVLTPNQPVGRHRRGDLPVVVGTANGGGSAPPTITIALVSQTAGKAAGGSVLIVNGTNFVVGMTALRADLTTFGTVSAVTANSCQVVTVGGTAGTTDTWHFHKTGSTDSAGQSFLYVAPPVQSAIAPNAGPGTLTNTGVVFTVSGLGAAASNIPISGTVGAGNIANDSIAITDATHFTADFTAPGLGADAVAVSVDGIAATGSVTFTGNNAPIFSSATAVSTAGGVSRIRGQNFDNSGTGIATKIAGATATLNTFTDSTNYTVNAPAHAAGQVSIQVINPDGQSDTNSTGFLYDATVNPNTIFGADLEIWGAPDSMNGSGAVLNSWSDKTANAHNLTPLATKAVYTASDPNFNGLSSANGAAAAAYLATAVSLGATGQGFLVAMVCRANSAPGTTRVVSSYDGTSCETQLQTSGIVRISGHGLNVNASAASSVGSTVQLYTLLPAGTNGNPNTVSAATSNATASTSTGTQTGTMGASSTFSLFGRADGSLLADVTIAEFVVVRMNAVNQTQLDQLAAYFFFKYALTSPSLSTTQLPTPIDVAGGGSRFLGAGFVPGMTIALQAGGVTVYGPAAATVKSATVAELPGITALSAGLYDVLLTNPDGGQVLVQNVFTVTATKSTMTIFGLMCEGLYRGAGITQAGGNVSAIADASNNAQDATLTPATKPTYLAIDTTLNSQPSWTCDGVASYIAIPSFVLDASTGQAMWFGGAMRFPANPAAIHVPLAYASTGTVEVQFQTTGIPRASTLGPTPTWTADIHSATVPHFLRVHLPAGAAGTSHTTSINVDNGTEQTATGNYSATLAASAQFTMGARAGGSLFQNVVFGEVAIIKGDPTPTQEADYKAYLHSTYGTP